MKLALKVSPVVLAVALAAGGICAAAPAAQTEADHAAIRQVQVERAIASGVKFLASQIGPHGRVGDEYPLSDRRHLFGGKTALCAYALLAAGESEDRNAAVRRAIEWLAGAKLDGVYPVAMRACAMSLVRDKRAAPLLQADVRWLVEAADSNGAYTYTAQGGRQSSTYDNCSSQMAVAGVWAGAGRGVEVPRAYWQKVRQHWLDQQQVDGGWGYLIPPSAVRTRTYGSMTAAGLATLYSCFDVLQADQFTRVADSSEYKPIARALAWLGANFKGDENPRHGVEWYHYWLFCVQRVGVASGYKYIGADDWYSAGAAALLRQRHDDGSWGVGTTADRLVPTAFSLLFLATGRHPVLFNKLQYEGRWNSRPRDLANLTRWLAYALEKQVAWQVVGLNSTLEDWHDAPILYISGAGRCELSDEQMRKLRQFVLQGGTIVSESAGNSGTFTLDIRHICRQLFPDWPLKPLGDKHPIYSVRFTGGERAGLAGVSNGIRLLAVHSPKELSLGLQLGPEKANLPSFQLMANIGLFATDRGILRPRGSSPWPVARSFKPVATMRVARIQHPGNCDPEPLAWQRLAVIIGNRHGIRLDAAEPAPADKLDAGTSPVAAMTGTQAFTLSKAEAEALAKYISDGGVLIADAAGGSPEFADSFLKQVVPLIPGAKGEPLGERHPIYKGVADGRVLYRGDYAESLGPGAVKGRLLGVYDGQRLAIIFSEDDMTAGLVGYPCYKLRGYTPATAMDLMINILIHAAGVKTPAAQTQPASR